MPDYKLDVKVPKSLIKKIRAIDGAGPEIKKTTLQAVLTVHQNTPGYPPKPEGSTYDRTGTLGRTVTTLQGAEPQALSRVESISGGFTGFIGTKLKYAPYVIGEEQTKKHAATGWYKLLDVLQDNKKRIIGLYQDLLKRLSNNGE